MNIRKPLLCVSVLLLLWPAPGLQADEDHDAVRDTFTQFRRAIIDGQGEEAAKLVLSPIFDYYGTILKLARTAKEVEVRQLSLTDKLFVLMVRQNISRERLWSMDEKDLFTYGVDNGWISKETFEIAEIGDIRIVDGIAEGQFWAQGNETGAHFSFEQEKGSWKLDLLAFMEISTVFLNQIASQQEMEEDDFVLLLLERMGGQPVDPKIWQPPSR